MLLLLSGLLLGEQPLAVADAAGVGLPQGVAPEGFAAHGAGQLAGVGVGGVGVVYAAGGALLAQEGAGVGHFREPLDRGTVQVEASW